ncbi:DUF4199 domain-containing protein [uncultured Winogradskyella sp.]|uniref:DUF4199 domain-containing protein n=1 Tax=uncultured Winogradskyella sp. TaxID=395353 RepID=UPI0030DAE619|tara:strand:- start:12 stop:524 length:513 start_codon:yes stop_codon:yes gene_type:complete
MEHKTPSIKPIAYTYGLYSALLSITGLIIMYVANMDKNWTLSIISLVISVLIFVYGIKAFKNANANVLSIGQAIKVGLAIAVIAGVITAIYSYVHYEFVYPEFIEMQRETAYNQMMESNPNMTEEQVDQAMGISNIFMNSTFFSLSSILGSLIFGLIVSLIAGLIMRSDH